MKVLFVVSEVAPIIKLGGLGDVAGSLPKALEGLGVDVDVVVPFFPIAKVEKEHTYKSIDLNVPFGGENYPVEVFNTKLPKSNVDVILLKNAQMFTDGGQNAFAGNVSETEMFSFFDRAVVELIKSKFNTYDLVHCNDWHTGFVTHLLHDELAKTRPATLLTIHNLMYQGIGDLDMVSEVGIVPGEHALIDWDISDGDVNLMLQGITSSDFLSTVSPSYAKEILTKEFGGDLCDVLNSRSGRLLGILNGVDYASFPRNYDISNVAARKKEEKKLLQEKLGLEVCDKPLFSFIGRLDPKQKGLDILFKAIPAITQEHGQFALLGTGVAAWEEALKGIGNSPNLSINIKFDVDLARLMYSGSDFLVVPSKYEPCGLIQMIAMWYGTLPVVHAVGGLKDTVQDGITGFTFDTYSSEALLESIRKACGVFKDSSKISMMIHNAMSADFSWAKSAQKYKELYERVVRLRKLAVELSEEEDFHTE